MFDFSSIVLHYSYHSVGLYAGQLRVWKFSDGKCVFSKTVLHAKNNKNKESSKDESGQQIVHATLCRTLGMIAVVTFDHNIILHELASLTRTKQVLPIKINLILQ